MDRKWRARKFRNGKFKLTDAETGVSIIERKGTRQTEYAETWGLILEFKVKWLSECSYRTELRKIIKNDRNMEFPEGMILTTEIIEVKENSYIQRTSSNLSDMVLEGELFRMD